MVLNNFVKAACLSACLGLASGSVLANNVETNGGLHVYDANDNAHWFNLTGKMQLDQTFYHNTVDGKNSVSSTLNLRRVQTDLKGGLGQDLSYSLRLSRNGNNVQMGKAQVTFSGFNSWSSVSVGQVDMPYGLDNSTFTEQNVARSVFAPSAGDEALGVAVTVSNDKLGFKVAVNQPSSQSIGNPGEFNTSARLSFAPLVRDNMVFHLGLSAHLQQMNGGNVTFTPKLAKHGASSLQAITDTATGDSQRGFGIDAAVLRGPIFLQGEFHTTTFQGKPAPVAEAWGYSVEGSYALTGETREYNRVNGSFSDLSTDRDSGSWQVAVRHSAINVKNANLRTVGASVAWTVNDNLSVLANYDNALEQKQGALSLRVQAAW
jgi:phosphate-selective porin OprO/OprP